MIVCQNLGPKTLVCDVPRPCCGRRHGTLRLKMPRQWGLMRCWVWNCALFGAVFGGVDWVHSIFVTCCDPNPPKMINLKGMLMVSRHPNSTKQVGCAQETKRPRMRFSQPQELTGGCMSGDANCMTHETRIWWTEPALLNGRCLKPWSCTGLEPKVESRKTAVLGKLSTKSI